MKIIIRAVWNDLFWYKELKGTIFNVVRETNSKEFENGQSKCYFVKYEGEIKAIAEIDAQIIDSYSEKEINDLLRIIKE